MKDTGEFKSLVTPIYRASTIVFDNFSAFINRRERQPDGFSYGLTGTPTNRVLESEISRLHEGAHTVVLPSGQAAIILTLLSFLKTGDHVVAPDNCYGPVREFFAKTMSSLGVSVTFVGHGSPDLVENAITPNTAFILLESPGSVTMEMQDVSAIADLARKNSIKTIIDNSWASPLNFKPLSLGIDFVVEALSKVISGHSDLLMGSVTTNNAEMYARLRLQQDLLGMYVSPDDCYLTLRGLETYPLRLERQAQSTIAIAQWLERHPAVEQVFYPALESSPDYALFKETFKGAGCLLSFSLKNEERMGDVFDSFNVFSIGASWGGTKSLVAYYPQSVLNGRNHNSIKSSLIRVSVGLEPFDQLIEDLNFAIENSMTQTSL